MRNTDDILGAGRACVDSQELIQQSFVLIAGANVAWTSQRLQIAKTKNMIRKSRRQIARLKAKSLVRDTV
jgi:hypothetical protein